MTGKEFVDKLNSLDIDLETYTLKLISPGKPWRSIVDVMFDSKTRTIGVKKGKRESNLCVRHYNK